MVIFVDESGPTEEYVVLGVVACRPEYADALRNHLDQQAAEIERIWPKLVNLPEWKGSVCGRNPTRSHRKKIRTGEEPNRTARPAIYARALAATQRTRGVWAMALTYSWTSAVTPASRGADYRLRRATLLALAALEAADFVVTHATVDAGHEAGYTAAFGEHFLIYQRTQISPSFANSVDDRRLQLADLIASAAKQLRFPAPQYFPGMDQWFDGLVGARLIRDRANPDQRRIEP